MVETGSESTMAAREVRGSCTLHGDSFALFINPSLSRIRMGWRRDGLVVFWSLRAVDSQSQSRAKAAENAVPTRLQRVPL